MNEWTWIEKEKERYLINRDRNERPSESGGQKGSNTTIIQYRKQQKRSKVVVRAACICPEDITHQ
jgi:hypothetical protein